MIVYYVNLALIAVLGWLLCVRNPTNPKKIIYLAITFGYMWFIATFREGIGNDYQNYIAIFEEIRAANGLSGLMELNYEPGFVLISKVMSLFVHSPVVMYGVYELLILLPIVWFIYRHCEDVWFSTWLFVTLTFFYTSMNFVRQSLACSVIVMGYDFLRKRKTLAFLLIVLLAMSMHKTVFIMIPVYFICHFPLNKKVGIFYGATTLFLFLFSSPILDFVTQFVFSEYRDTVYLKQGLDIIFLMLPAVVFGGCLSLYPVWKERSGYAPILLNLMMYNCIIWLFLTRHFILERFSMYVYIFVLVAIPDAIRALRASPETISSYESIRSEMDSSKKKPGKEKEAKLAELGQIISDHKKYYWSAVAAMLLISLFYNEFGMYNNGFHGVFPYRSVLSWLP